MNAESEERERERERERRKRRERRDPFAFILACNLPRHHVGDLSLRVASQLPAAQERPCQRAKPPFISTTKPPSISTINPSLCRPQTLSLSSFSTFLLLLLLLPCFRGARSMGREREIFAVQAFQKLLTICAPVNALPRFYPRALFFCPSLSLSLSLAPLSPLSLLSLSLSLSCSCSLSLSLSLSSE